MEAVTTPLSASAAKRADAARVVSAMRRGMRFPAALRSSSLLTRTSSGPATLSFPTLSFFRLAGGVREPGPAHVRAQNRCAHFRDVLPRLLPADSHVRCRPGVSEPDLQRIPNRRADPRNDLRSGARRDGALMRVSGRFEPRGAHDGKRS
jgi:hypothetical protein